MIPLKRPLYPPDDPFKRKTEPGDDVLAIKRVVSRYGCWPWGEFDDTYYNGFAHGHKNKLGIRIKGQEGVAGFEKKLGISATGNWGQGIHEKSQRVFIPNGMPHEGEPLWDQFSINLYRGFEDLGPAEQMINDIFEWWSWLVFREPAYHYSQERLIPIIRQRRKPPSMPNKGDCSGTFIGCAWLAGAVSPDRFYGYSGAGNTDSLIRSGIAINKSDIDTYVKTHYVAVFYGHSMWNTTHVVAARNSHMFYSHGREAGPEIITDINYHTLPVVGIRAYPVL